MLFPTIASLTLTSALALTGDPNAAVRPIRVVYQGPEAGRNLNSWTFERIRAEGKWVERSEEGRNWEGVTFLSLLERSFEELTPEERSLTDWLVVTTYDGKRVSFPRFLTNRYQVLVGRAKDRPADGWHLVLPVEAQPKIRQEFLPLSALRGVSIQQITFTRLEAVVAQDLFLRDRSNPLALRGEKRFLQTCVACHQGQSQYQGANTLLREIPKSHPKLENWTRLDWIGLEMYRKQLATHIR